MIGLDKLVHVLMFVVLAWLADYAFPASRFYLDKALPLFGYGVLMELVQWPLPYRSFSFLDMVADGSGLVLYPLFSSHLQNLPILRLRWQLTGRNDC